MIRFLLSAALVFTVSSAAATVDQCGAMRRHGQVSAARQCYEALLRDRDSAVRAEGYFGLKRYDEANTQFREAYKEHPHSAAVRVRWGELLWQRFNVNDWPALLQEAIQLDPNYAPAYLASARASASGYEEKAVDLARQAAKLDPKMTEAHELLAYLALEDDDTRTAADEAKQALALSAEALDGMAVLASIDWLNGKPGSEWMDRVLKVNPVYGEAYETGAHFLVINRRYEEAITLYRKALALEPDLWAARSQLGINLMRLGFDEEAGQQLRQCFEEHYRDAQTVNALRLLDREKDYQTFKTGQGAVKLQKKEAALLRLYMEPEFTRAIATYQKKYKMKPAGPLRLEVYPNHEDFMVRVLGLPGQGGLLGVTFGLVVAMDSPSARPAGEFNWDSTMWHELSHAFVVTATHNLVPRWFTEGLSVHEEGAASPAWGDRMTPDIVEALQKKRLLPVLELDRGFVRHQYPTQVLVSYFEAGKMIDYIAQKWGDEAVLGMIHAFAARKTTAQAIEENLHEPPEAFDKEFMAWLDGKTAKMVGHFDEWKKDMKAARESLKQGNAGEALRQGLAVLDYFPEYVGGGNTYELLAEAYLANNDKAAAMKQWERYRDEGGMNVKTLEKLAALETESGLAAQAEATLNAINTIYPEDEQLHKKLGALQLARGDANGAIREFEAVLAMQNGDPAESHLQLAKAFRAANRLNEAKDQVLLALEAAPNFKPAQQLLLQLSQ